MDSDKKIRLLQETGAMEHLFGLSLDVADSVNDSNIRINHAEQEHAVNKPRSTKFTEKGVAFRIIR